MFIDIQLLSKNGMSIDISFYFHRIIEDNILLWTKLIVAAWEVKWMSVKYTEIDAVNKEIITRAKWNDSEIYVIENKNEDIVHHLILLHSIHWGKYVFFGNLAKTLEPSYFHMPFLNHLWTSVSSVTWIKTQKSRKKWMFHKHLHKQV